MIKNWLFISSLGLIPAYIYPSGTYQIVDVPLTIIILYVLLFDHNIHYVRPIKYFIPFVLWAILISLYYYTLDMNLIFIKSMIPILYAPFILFTFTNVFADILEKNQISFIYFGLFLSLFITFIVKGTPDEQGRAILSFNDPNQLGYFGVILLGYMILLFNYKALTNNNDIILIISDFFILILAHYFMILSVSRTAMITFLVMDIYLFKYFKKNIGFSLTLFLSFLIVFVFFVKPHFIQRRIEIRPSKDYSQKQMVKDSEFRMLHPLSQLKGIQFVIGRGEGIGMEAHNFIMEIFRGYGLIGVVLFLYWLFKAISMSWVTNDILFIWASLLLYNMGNYGLRWRGFWILLGFLFALAVFVEKNKFKKFSGENRIKIALVEKN